MFIELAKVLGFIHSTCWTLNNRSNQVEHACSSSLAIQIKNLSLKDTSKEKEMSVSDTRPDKGQGTWRQFHDVS